MHAGQASEVSILQNEFILEDRPIPLLHHAWLLASSFPEIGSTQSACASWTCAAIATSTGTRFRDGKSTIVSLGAGSRLLQLGARQDWKICSNQPGKAIGLWIVQPSLPPCATRNLGPRRYRLGPILGLVAGVHAVGVLLFFPGWIST